MKAIVAKLDDETARALDELARGGSRSEVIRTAITQYLAAQKISRRRREVEEYMRSGEDQEAMKSLAEADIEHADALLRKVEENR